MITFSSSICNCRQSKIEVIRFGKFNIPEKAIERL